MPRAAGKSQGRQARQLRSSSERRARYEIADLPGCIQTDLTALREALTQPLASALDPGLGSGETQALAARIFVLRQPLEIAQGDGLAVVGVLAPRSLEC